MSLQYKILWFEDDHEIISDYAPEVVKYLFELGFDAIIKHCENGNLLEENIKEEFDLILTDLNLSDSENGDKLIERIREHFILTEVLFYSGNAQGIEEIIKSHRWVERVSFLAGIDGLNKKIRELVYLTVKKFQETNTVRGIVMAETSILDQSMIEIILDFLTSFQFDEANKRRQELISVTIINREERLKKMKETAIDQIEQFCEILDVGDRIGAINRLIKYRHKITDSPSFKENSSVLNDYFKDIVNPRNLLAHANEVVEDGEKVLRSTMNGKSLVINDTSCTQLRKDITKHKKNLEEIQSKIKETR